MKTILSRVDTQLVPFAIEFCQELKAIISLCPEVLEQFQSFMYDYDDEEAVMLHPQLYKLLVDADDLCTKLGSEYVLLIPAYSTEAIYINDLTLGTPGTVAARFYRDILYIYIKRLWDYVNNSANVVLLPNDHVSVGLDMDAITEVDLI